MAVIPLVIDENVPESVTLFFKERGHDVKHVRDLFLAGSPDPIIAAAADRMGAVIVTWNSRDFRKLAARIPRGGRAALKRVGRITFRCSEANGRRRAELAIDMIEAEYERAQTRADKRLFVDVTETTVSFNV